METKTKRILILGGGFGGLVTAEKLAESIGSDHEITLVSPNRKFTFYPALVRLAFGKLKEEDVTFDLAEKLSDIGVKFVEGEVLHLKPEIHRVQVAGKEFNGEISYDHLVIAMGRRLATEKIYGFFDHANHLLGVKAAQKFAKAVDEFKSGNIVVGLSPDAFLPVPVCETAFALADRLLADPAENDVKISVVFPKTVKDAFGGANIHETLEEAFSKHNIELIEDFPITKILKNKVFTSDEKEIPYDLLMLIPPFRGQARLMENRITDDLNFVEVDRYLRVEGMKNAYAVGDIVAYPGPKLAHIAVAQANVAAENIISELQGDEPKEVYYHEIAAIIDQGGSDSIYLNYGFWDDSVYRLKTGSMWGMVKRIHDKLWRNRHGKT
ncbi:MAG: FAD-dependent oxidoreductase [Acidobacteria bacterium]|nr:FAD-dependent oxidoreductase [Acidobacteriota bacterium]